MKRYNFGGISTRASQYNLSNQKSEFGSRKSRSELKSANVFLCEKMAPNQQVKIQKAL